MKRFTLLYLSLILMLLTMATGMQAQRPNMAKLSRGLRNMEYGIRSTEYRMNASKPYSLIRIPSPKIMSFVRIGADGKEVLRENGCKIYADFGDIVIADIPKSRIAALTLQPAILRIEAERGTKVTMDTTRQIVDALPVYAGTSLPQAYDGKGVLVGVEDIGFDLTHPNFYSPDMQRYRIRQLWDQLSTDTIGSPWPVGRDYCGQEALLSLGCTRDGHLQTHGTHTLGIATGSGYSTAYKGMAPEADIVLVCNATSNDAELIDSTMWDRYTYATDALGFKYMFDLADSLGMPCVVSFSQGSAEDFHGDDQLYYEILNRLAGPGHILVASAGNESVRQAYLRKPSGRESAGAFVWKWSESLSCEAVSQGDFAMRYLSYADSSRPDTIAFNSKDITALEDSTLIDTITTTHGERYMLAVMAYPNCYNSTKTVFYVYLQLLSDGKIGMTTPLSVELIGSDADVECFYHAGEFHSSDIKPSLADGSTYMNILSPGSAPSVICVGATAWREQYTNMQGEQRGDKWGNKGLLGGFSSTGPTYDQRVKPNVVAPGTNIISSINSFYEDGKSDDALQSDVARLTVGQRRYSWGAESGTSMSTPVVAGAIALWLQAKPTLTPEEIKDVLAATCRQPDATLSYPNNQYGYGEIDVYRGLLHILGLAGISSISQTHPAGVAITQQGRIITLHFSASAGLSNEKALHSDTNAALTGASAAPKDYKLSVFNLRGNCVMSVSNQPAIDLSTLPIGVYALQITSSNKLCRGSWLIRLK